MRFIYVLVYKSMKRNISQSGVLLLITLLSISSINSFKLFDFSEDLGECRFASLYSPQDLYTNSTLRDEFKWRVFGYEGNFAKNGVGLNIATGMTYDGHGINYTTFVFSQ